MKISKLFHWLYAFLMFLPITFILPTLLYFGFNDNATAQEYTKEEPIYYETNEVNSVDDLVTGNVYTLSYNNVNVGNVVQWVQVSEYLNVVGEVASSGIGALSRTVAPYLMLQQQGAFVIFADYSYYAYHSVMVDFVFNEEVSETNSTLIDLISSCPRLYVKETISYTYTMGITESVNQAIIDTFDLPMFSWATNNILVAPFASICSFFGIASTSVLIKYLYYWLTISVIWLVFDVLMYIPLLVHNYIDKARIE